MAATAYSAQRYEFLGLPSGGNYLLYKKNTPNFTVRVEKSASNDWAAALDQFGGGSATVRVCIGDQKTDFTVSIGNLSTPAGWSGDGQTYATKTIIMDAPYISPYTFASAKIFEASSSWIPSTPGYPGTLTFGQAFDQWKSTLQSSLSEPTSSVVVYAYEIDPPSGIYTNDPSWFPNWQIFSDGEFEYIDGDGAGPIDKQLTSIFQTRVSVSQNSYKATCKSVLMAGGDIGLSGAVDTTGKGNTTITITLDPQLWIGSNPVINTKPQEDPPGAVDPFPVNIINITLPNKDGGGSNGGGPYRPVRPGGTSGGGGTPVYQNYIELEVTPDPIEHINTDVGTFRTKSFTVKNIGTLSVDVDEIINTHPDNPFPFSMSSPTSFPFTLEPTHQVGGLSYFLPADDILYSEIGYIRKNGVILKSFGVKGTGTTSGNPGDTPLRSISLRGNTATSGDTNFLEQTIGEATTRQIYAVNSGTVPVVLNSVSLGGAGVFTTTGVTAGINVPVGEEIPINVTFTPVGAQQYLGTFTLNTNAQTSPQSGFNPATGAITCNLQGKGTIEEVLTRIMSFQVQNNGTFEDVLAGGSAFAELDATITSIGTASVAISQFQVEPPFTLELGSIGTYTLGIGGFYNLNGWLVLEPGETSPVFKIKFTPPTATNYVDDVYVASNKTLGPESFEVRGTGTFEVPPEPEEPDVPVTPDDEPPPGQEFDPGTVPSSDLDGNGSACISKGCDVTYVYEYSSNGEIVT